MEAAESTRVLLRVRVGTIRNGYRILIASFNDATILKCGRLDARHFFQYFVTMSQTNPAKYFLGVAPGHFEDTFLPRKVTRSHFQNFHASEVGPLAICARVLCPRAKLLYARHNFLSNLTDKLRCIFHGVTVSPYRTLSQAPRDVYYQVLAFPKSSDVFDSLTSSWKGSCTWCETHITKRGEDTCLVSCLRRSAVQVVMEGLSLHSV